MNSDLLLPIVTSIAWLVLACVGLASHRLKLGQMVKMALVWIVVFGGLFVLVEWFLIVQGTASSVI
ncbi:MAG: hypothetical protein EAY70_09175 [Sphingomonadales bacterium]|nr:MAG: hypothetical protein EAY70_09175 [Sphingomonadales bacterium]